MRQRGEGNERCIANRKAKRVPGARKRTRVDGANSCARPRQAPDSLCTNACGGLIQGPDGAFHAASLHGLAGRGEEVGVADLAAAALHKDFALALRAPRRGAQHAGQGRHAAQPHPQAVAGPAPAAALLLELVAGQQVHGDLLRVGSGMWTGRRPSSRAPPSVASSQCESRREISSSWERPPLRAEVAQNRRELVG